MAAGFLLRFQERVEPTPLEGGAGTVAGTQTTTKVVNEGADLDPRSRCIRVIPSDPADGSAPGRPAPRAGTQTFTEVNKETDSDPAARSRYCIPRP